MTEQPRSNDAPGEETYEHSPEELAKIRESFAQRIINDPRYPEITSIEDLDRLVVERTNFEKEETDTL